MTNLKSSPTASRQLAPSAEPTPGSGVSSELLLGGKSELKIRHNGELYCLRQTRLGKLILTK